MLKKIKISILSFIIPFSILSCKDESLIKWEVLDSSKTNLKEQGESFEKFLINGKDFFIIGQEDTEFNNWSDFKAITYESKNSGKKWAKIINDKGAFVDGYYSFNELFLFRETYSINSFDKAVLNLINAKKKTTYHRFKERSSIKNVFINSKEEGVLILNNSYTAADNSILYTNNNFKSFDSISFKKGIKKCAYLDEKVYLLSDDYFIKNYKTIERNKLYIVNRKILDSIELKNVVDDFCVDKNGIYLLSKENGKVTINHINEKKQKMKTQLVVDDQGLEPKRLYKYNNFIAVLVNSINSKGLGGFGSVSYKLYISLDNGETYKEEKLPINDYVEPIEFYKDELIIFYAGAGRICRGNVK